MDLARHLHVTVQTTEIDKILRSILPFWSDIRLVFARGGTNRLTLHPARPMFGRLFRVVQTAPVGLV